jgi:phosphoesterase RecJ-like protein
MPIKKEFVPAAEFLKNFNGKILLASHENPDGDTVGSTLALYLFLKKLGKDVSVACKDPIPYYLDFLPAAADFKRLPLEEEFDLCVIVDAASHTRLGAPVRARRFMRVDHHKGGDFYSEADIVDAEAPATASVVYYLLKNIDESLIDKQIAECIYTGLSTDTGFFINSNTDASTLKLATELVEKFGIKPHEIASNIKERNRPGRLKLLSKALETITLHGGGKIATMYVLKKWLEETETGYEDTEGFVNYARSIDGVEVAALITERPEEGIWKVSLRSKGHADVSVVCEKFGGGGHKYAAGCKFPINLPLEEVIKRLTEEVSKNL